MNYEPTLTVTVVPAKTGMELARSAMETPAQRKVDGIRKACESAPQIDCPLTHRFTPGLYTREIFMPSGTFIISKIHATEHPYVIISGRASVWVEGVGVVRLEAPYVGITKPGTRRILYIHEDCRWLTFHPTERSTVDEVEGDIILPPCENDKLVALDVEIIRQLKAAQ